jgi:exodeoxyribonuclease-3
MLLAIWANNAQDPGRYIEQVWNIHYYDKLLQKPIILTGDFNSNTIWDKPRREGNHTAVVQQLAKKNIHSIYHQQYQQEQGKEAHPIFYLQRKKEKASA